MGKGTIFGLLLAFASAQVGAELATFSAGKKAFNKIYDGDSLNMRLRLAHIDSPEIKGECPEEIQLARRARDYTQAFVDGHRNVQIAVVATGRYGRPLVEVRAEQRYLNQELVDKGFARVWEGRRESWCR